MKYTVPVGFGIVILLMFILAGVSIYQNQSTNTVVSELVEVSNVKTEYAHTMRDAILRRQLALISIMGTRDPFVRDEEIVRFYSFALPYREARKALLELPMTATERELHERLTNQTRIAQPLNREVAELIRQDASNAEVMAGLQKAQEAQSELLKMLSSLVELQKQYGQEAVEHSRETFKQALIGISVIVALVLIISVVTAYYVTRFVAASNKSMMSKNMLLKREFRRAEEATRTKSEFLANMSHEIRTPLTAIIGFAETSLFSNQTMKERQHALQTIIDSGKHLLQIINDILDLSKIEANKLEVEKIPVSPFEMLQDVEGISQPLAHAKNLNFVINYIFPLPATIQTDPLRIKQIILNLCSNAIKFTQQGHVRINVSYNELEKRMIFEVVDTGIGLSAEQMEVIFQPFQQADSSTNRKFGGTGLGLSLSADLAAALGGELSVTSEAGGGSSFTLKINTGELDEVSYIYSKDEIPLKDMEIASLLTAAQLRGHVLLAEDNEINQKLVTIYLNRMGVEVTIADNGKQAMEFALSEDYDLILMDMQMPVMDGLQALAELRTQGYDKPIVVLTANAMSEDRKRARDTGADGFLSKPIDTSEFYKVVADFLPRSHTVVVEQGPIVSSLVQEDPGLTELVNSYIAQIPPKIEQIETELHERNWEQLKATLHEFKGTSGNLGLIPLFELVRKMEFQALNENEEESYTLFHELNNVYARIVAGQQMLHS